MEYFEQLAKVFDPGTETGEVRDAGPREATLAVSELWERIKDCHDSVRRMHVTCIVDFPYRDLRGSRNQDGLELPLDLALLERAWVFDVSELSGAGTEGLRMIIHGHTLTRWKDRDENPTKRTKTLTAVNARLVSREAGSMFKGFGQPLQIVPVRRINWRHCLLAGENKATWQLQQTPKVPDLENKDAETKSVYTILCKVLTHAESALRLVARNEPEYLDQFFFESIMRRDTMELVRGNADSMGVPEVHFLHRSPSRKQGPLIQPSVPSGSQDLHEAVVTETAVPRVRALCIGVDKYDHFRKLNNAASDALALHNTINGLGLSRGHSTLYPNPADKTTLMRTVLHFCKEVGASGMSDLVLVFYAGHGLQVQAEIYLVPTKAEVEEDSMLRTECLALGELYSLLSTKLREEQRVLVIIDACRTSLNHRKSIFETAFDSADRCGPEQSTSPKNLALMLASSRGGRAWDSTPDTLNHSPIVHELLHDQRGAFAPDMDLSSALNTVCQRVEELTNSKQRPDVMRLWKLESIVLNPQTDDGGMADETIGCIDPQLRRELKRAKLTPDDMKIIVERFGVKDVSDLQTLASPLKDETLKELVDLRGEVVALNLVGRTKFLNLMLEHAAEAVSDPKDEASDAASEATTDGSLNASLSDISICCHETEVVAAYSSSNVTDFQTQITAFLQGLSVWFEKSRPFPCLMILMETLSRMHFHSGDEISARMWFAECKQLRLNASVIAGFESLYLAGTPPKELRTLSPEHQDRHLGCVHVIDRYVRCGFAHSFPVPLIRRWNDEVMGPWRASNDDAELFCSRADNFLVHEHPALNVEQLSQDLGALVLDRPYPTHSYVAFLVLQRISEMILFTYLRLRNFESDEATEHNWSNPFIRFVSSAGNVWTDRSTASQTRGPQTPARAARLLHFATAMNPADEAMLPLKLHRDSSCSFVDIMQPSAQKEEDGAQTDSPPPPDDALKHLREVCGAAMGVGSRVQVLWNVKQRGQQQKVWWGAELTAWKGEHPRLSHRWQISYDAMEVNGDNFGSEECEVAFLSSDELVDLSSQKEIVHMRWLLEPASAGGAVGNVMVEDVVEVVDASPSSAEQMKPVLGKRTESLEKDPFVAASRDNEDGPPEKLQRVDPGGDGGGVQQLGTDSSHEDERYRSAFSMFGEILRERMISTVDPSIVEEKIKAMEPAFMTTFQMHQHLLKSKGVKGSVSKHEIESLVPKVHRLVRQTQLK